MTGAFITLGGAVITIVLNVILIPKLHYLGAAIATFSCFLFMMIVSYILGQKHYPVPYARKKLIAYLVLVIMVYGLHRGFVYLWTNPWFNLGIATALLIFFTMFVIQIEKKELQRIPVLRKFIRGKTADI